MYQVTSDIVIIDDKEVNQDPQLIITKLKQQNKIQTLTIETLKSEIHSLKKNIQQSFSNIEYLSQKSLHHITQLFDQENQIELLKQKIHKLVEINSSLLEKINVESKQKIQQEDLDIGEICLKKKNSEKPQIINYCTRESLKKEKQIYREVRKGMTFNEDDITDFLTLTPKKSECPIDEQIESHLINLLIRESNEVEELSEEKKNNLKAILQMERNRLTTVIKNFDYEFHQNELKKRWGVCCIF